MFPYLPLQSCKVKVIVRCMLGLLSLVAAAKAYSDVALSQEEVQEWAQQGFARADREVEKHHLEELKSLGRLNPEGIARLQSIDEMNQQYDSRKGLSRQAGDIAERARRVRALQYKLEEWAESSDFGAPRKRAVWRDEMRYLTHQTPELPELPPLPTSSTQNR